MKSDFHFHFYSRIFIMLILAVSVFAIQRSVPSTAEIASYPYEVTGWTWNDKARWISLNCYNDFESPGEYISTCATTGDYGLQINADGTVTGCIWGGNNLSGGTSPVGWICFNDILSGRRVPPSDPHPSDFGVTTSSDPAFPNALASTTFASILSLENWLCVGGTYDGQRCGPVSNLCSSGGGVCTFTDNQEWKLGFPLGWNAANDFNAPDPNICSNDYDMPCSSDVDCPGGTCGRDIEGCFNCYEEIIYKCQSNTDSWDPVCDPDNNACGLVGTVPNQYQDPCVPVDVEKKCDNCLEYLYYPGYCWSPTTATSTSMRCSNFVDETDDCCRSNNDCSGDEICLPVSSCGAYEGGAYFYQYDCTHNPSEDGVCEVLHNCVEHELNEPIKTLGGYNCSDCTIESYDNRCILNADRKNLNRCESCESVWYWTGVMIDNRHYGWNQDIDPLVSDPAPNNVAYMCGWAWNAWDENSDGIVDNGFYWFNFSPRVTTSTKPYLFVDSGSIYSQKGLTNDYLPPTGYYNSSFLIESGGAITNFISSSTLSGIYQGELPYQPIIDFLNLDASGKYSNALGSIDYDGLIDVVNATLGTNKYGSYVVTGVPITNVFSLLDDRDQVYYYPTDVTLNNGVNYNFALGDEAWEVAAKTIVVNGDLMLGDNVDYATSSVPNIYSNFKNIPSVVWVVRGDLLIDVDVSKVAGTFIVLGDGGGDCSGESARVGCGRIVTCYDSGTAGGTCRTSPLTLSGNVFARYFDLGRTYIDPVNPAPSERFVNDGRLQVNTPAGFIDFSNIVPRFIEQ